MATTSSSPSTQRGPFTINFPFPILKNEQPGSGSAICGYSTYPDDESNTAAWANTVYVVSPTAKPSVTQRPKIARSGNRLRCSPGRWSQAQVDVPMRYQWRIAHERRTAGRKPTLAINRKLRGHSITCQVTAKNSLGSTTATSRPFKVKGHPVTRTRR